MDILPSFVNKQFFKVVRCSYLSNNLKNDLTFHNSSRLKILKKGPETYNGKYNCGITSFILGNILKNNFQVKMYLYETGYGKYKEDHVFLKVNDIIIDPTYRQFFTDNRNGGFSYYNNYLYQNLNPFFVGSQKELETMCTILKKKNKEEFKYSGIENNILDIWKYKYDITNKLDDFHKIYNKDYVRYLMKI